MEAGHFPNRSNSERGDKSLGRPNVRLGPTAVIGGNGYLRLENRSRESHCNDA
jgi:hypothetical protein